VDLAAVLKARQGSRIVTPDRVARQLFVLRWREQGASLSQLRTFLGLSGNAAVLALERRGREAREIRSAAHLAECQAHDRPSPPHYKDRVDGGLPAHLFDRVQRVLDRRAAQRNEENPAGG
jgi:DNA-binding transcriptional MerR regulator